MEIIKRGQPPSEKRYTATCKQCKTVVSFSRGEATVYSDQREGTTLTVQCPVCPSSIHAYD